MLYKITKGVQVYILVTLKFLGMSGKNKGTIRRLEGRTVIREWQK
jgi:hypothetical protein